MHRSTISMHHFTNKWMAALVDKKKKKGASVASKNYQKIFLRIITNMNVDKLDFEEF